LNVFDTPPAVNVTVPERAAPVFWSTQTATIRPPGPVGSLVPSHGWSDAAAHESWFVVTVTAVDPEPAYELQLEPDSDNAAAGAFAWVTVTVFDSWPMGPSAVTVTRAVLAAPAFGAATRPRAPPGSPDAGEADSHGESEAAVHESWFVDTVTAAAPPAGSSDTLVLDRPNVADGPAFWETATVLEAFPAVTVTVPDLAGPRFAAAATVTDPPDEPDAGDAVNHAASEAAAHDAWSVVTFDVVEPAAAAADHDVRESVSTDSLAGTATGADSTTAGANPGAETVTTTFNSWPASAAATVYVRAVAGIGVAPRYH
jgi:hypothetical protein